MSYQLLPLNEHDDIETVSGVEFHKPSIINRTSAKLRLVLFLSTVALSVITFHAIVGFVHPSDLDGATNVSSVDDTTWPSSSSPHPYLRPGLGQYVVPGEEEWDMNRIQEMVSKTKGFYARDYPLGLGWNNMRYIIEASLLHAHLLNRTLILPSYVYARGCERELKTCAEYSAMVNRGDAIGSDEWSKLPIDKQMAWRIPINIMMDLVHLRRSHAVVTVSEYLRLQGIAESVELTSGHFDRTEYLNTPTTPPPSLYVILNHKYDEGAHGGLIRVDKLPTVSGESFKTSKVTDWLLDHLKHGYNEERHVADMHDVERVLEGAGLKTSNSSEELEEMLESEGWVILYSFGGSGLHKSVAEPLKQIGRRELLHGFVDEYNDVIEDVVLLQGETHLYRPSGDLRFTSESARAEHVNTVLHDLLSIPPIVLAAERVADHMLKLNDGRMWIAAHMRRGDFVRLGWQSGDTLEHQLDRIEASVEQGTQVLRDMVENNVTRTTYNIPGVHVDGSFSHASPPEQGDKFYLATDERSETALTYFRENNATLIMDLLTPDDRRIVGWPLLFTDIVAVLDQIVMSRAAYFRGYAYSSVDGGVLNLRAARGMDPRLAHIDY